MAGRGERTAKVTATRPRRAPRKRPATASARPGGAPPSRPPRAARRASRPPARPSGLGLAVAAIVAVAAVLVVAVLGFGAAPRAGRGARVAIEWPAGELSSEEAARRLADAGLIGDASLFALYLRVTGGPGAFRTGWHLVRDDLSARGLVSRFEGGLLVDRARVTVPEGFHRFDLAKRLESAGVCAAAAFVAATNDAALLGELALSGPSAEGFLFPATYELAEDSDPREVVRRMKLEHDKRWEKLVRAAPGAVEALHSGLGFGPREIVTLASMVEKEAAVDDERPVIASVFLNRLRDPAFAPKRLQSDPTSAYGCLVSRDEGHPLASCEGYAGGGHVTPEMNRDDANAWSTYRHDGLPPGPIASPGERSLAAVLAPASTKFLYFVARGEGRHTFSETYERHQDAVKRPR